MGMSCCVLFFLASIMTMQLLMFHYTEATYTLTIRARNYWNGRHKLSDGTCCDISGSSSCDPWWCSHCQCDNRYKFCLRNHGTSMNGNENNCPLGSYSTGEIGDDRFSFGSTQIDSGVPNPMTFQGDIWQDGFQMLISIYDDDDTSSDDHVDDVYIEEIIYPKQTISNQEYIGRRSNAHIVVTISLSCDNSYYGDDCATYCIATNNDQGHYRCNRTTGEKICRYGWSDLDNNCLTPVCTRNCHVIGGYCNNPGECLCHDGWRGGVCRLCQPASGCSEVGGYCNVPGECICRDGYSGANCEIDLIPCQRGNPCSNGTLCTNDGFGGYICHCSLGYTGMECDQEINECDPNPCYNGSTCIDEVGGYNCVCPEGLEGDLCHLDIDECIADPCLNNGTCVDVTNGYVCLCADGYDGDVCESNHDDCIPYPCENGGKCQDLLGGFKCDCEVGWTGDRCQIDIDDCVPIPCQNEGTCYDRVNDYECLCVTGWEGENCELEINECVSNPCQNGAECTDLIASYNCTCIEGYYGSHCEHEYNECLSQPCLNDGVCEDLVNGYTCNCSYDFAGANCELNLNPCRNNPCQNGGMCLGQSNGDYACECAPGYTDYNCISEINPQVEGLNSETENEDGVMKYVVWGVPSIGVLILILIVAMAIVGVYCRRRRKRMPILPPPNEPMENGMETGGKGMGKESSGAVANPVYAAVSEPHVYESLDVYAISNEVPLVVKFPHDPSDNNYYCDTAMIMNGTGSIENHYFNKEY